MPAEQVDVIKQVKLKTEPVFEQELRPVHRPGIALGGGTDEVVVYQSERVGAAAVKLAKLPPERGRTAVFQRSQIQPFQRQLRCAFSDALATYRRRTNRARCSKAASPSRSVSSTAACESAIVLTDAQSVSLSSRQLPAASCPQWSYRRPGASALSRRSSQRLRQ